MLKEKKPVSIVLYTVGLFLLAAGLPLSVFLMSIGTGTLLIAFLADGDFSGKVKMLKRDRLFLLFASLFFLHLAGLIYTTDFKYAFNDIKTKIPLLLYPAVFLTFPRPTKKIKDRVIGIFILATFLSTLFSFLVYLEIIPVKKDISDVRNITVFVSHVRLALMICIVIILLFYKAIISREIKILPVIILSSWFLYFLYILESGTGFITLIALVLVILLSLLFTHKKKTIRITSMAVVSCSLVVFVLSVRKIYNDYYTVKQDISDLEMYTSEGNPYYHDMDHLTLENGYYLGLYQCREEMIPEWNAISKINFDSLDHKGQRIGFTLMRYLTSKGLRKDAGGVKKLTREDVVNIENGIANVDYTRKTGMRKRIEQILFEIDNYRVTGNAGGNSLPQRFEYWRTGWNIFLGHPFTGVGTGDAQLAFNEQYEKQKTNLPEEHWHRSHNQFLAFMVTFGITGLLIFAAVLLLSFLKANREKNVLYQLFLFCMILSFIPEDTLETQAGVTLFTFFHCFFLYFIKEKEAKTITEEAVPQFLQA